MDLDNLNCPQYIRFSSESFQASLNDDTISSDSMELSNQDSFLSDASTEDQQMSCSKENFEVHHRMTRSKIQKAKTKITIPKPFAFETDSRLKNVSVDSGITIGCKDFTSQLRQHKVVQSKTIGATKVKPFNLTESRKRKREEDYLPLAEQINSLQNKTPERYHPVLNQTFQPQQHWSPPKLQPKTPNLHAIKRRRVVEVLSREEQELQEIKGFEFHAQPVDPRIYKPIIIKKSGKKITKAKNIDLRTSQRQKLNVSSTPENAYEFRARPVPKNILVGPTGLGEKPKIFKTVANAPKFTTDERLKRRKDIEQKKPKVIPVKKAKVVKSKPIPKPVKPQSTEIKPFSFDKCDKERFFLKEKKIQEDLEKENKPFVFKAQLMPSPHSSALPKVSKRPQTKPQPFNFCLDKRILKQDVHFKEEHVSFKAQEPTVLYKQPFIPEKSIKTTVEVHEFNLHTDKRSSERLKLKEQKEAEEREKERIYLLQQALQEKKERQEILRLRKEIVHKANPIREYKPVEIKRGIIPPTVAAAPVFETDKRLQSRHEK